jgi:deoxyribodipyrimidine photo-lyase
MADTDDTDTGGATGPLASEIPAPGAVSLGDDTTGYVVWHRKHLRTDDHLALTRAVADGDVVCPLFVFDPSFYGDGGLACDARLRFLHEAVASLDRLYATVPVRTVTRQTPDSRDRLDGTGLLRSQMPDDPNGALAGADSPGLTVGYGDPVTLLSRFVDSDWSVLTMATPTSRYGKRRDDRVREVCGEGIEFVSGDGLVRGTEWSRTDWREQITSWLNGTQQSPNWGQEGLTRLTVDTPVTPAVVDEAFGVTPEKTKVPAGTHQTAAERLDSFVGRIRSYPERISAPQAARNGTSGLSPYLNFGLFSVRQVYQSVTERSPDCRGLKMFTDRLVWNLHYNQKLVDWPGWTDTAVNPVFEGFNEESHDPDLVQAWKRGQTGFPMVDAAMRCLRGTGWLNFRMRAMAASFFAHILKQPWWIGAEWYHHHLVDSDVAINYTQWQSQAGLIGKPAQRVYNPRKQVRDHDPEGEWITEWVPELSPLPSEFLDRPERTPLPVQEEHGVQIGEEYPRPVVEFEAEREAFWARYERHRPAAARVLARPEIAKRASFSGGYEAARAIASDAGREGVDAVQQSLSDISTGDGVSTDPDDTGDPDGSTVLNSADSGNGGVVQPTGVGRRAGEPSPDDRAALPDDRDSTENGHGTGGDGETRDDNEPTGAGQTTLSGFSS